MRCFGCLYAATDSLGISYPCRAVAIIVEHNGNRVPHCDRDLNGRLDLADDDESFEPAGLVFL